MNLLKKILDPVLGGKQRVIVALLSFAVAVLTSPSVDNLGFTWVTPVLTGLNFALSFMAHYTPVGNQPQPPQ